MPPATAASGVPAGDLLDDQQQRQRGHADAEPADDTEEQQQRCAGNPPDAQVLAQCGHGGTSQETIT